MPLILSVSPPCIPESLIDHSQAALPASSLVIICISTTGQGDFPGNASLFWKGLLRRKLTSSYLEHVAFAVFGLGDSSYPRYVDYLQILGDCRYRILLSVVGTTMQLESYTNAFYS